MSYNFVREYYTDNTNMLLANTFTFNKTNDIY